MENRRPYWQVTVSLVFSLLATAAFIIIGMKAIVFFMPFVIGWCISAIAAPVVNWLEKHFKIVKKLGSALIVVLVIGLIVLLIYLAVSRLVTEVGDLLKNIPDLYEQLANGLSQIGQSMSGLFARLPEEVRSGFQTMMSNLNEYMGDLISKIGEPTVTAAGNLAMRLPFFLVSVLVSVISAYFFTVERDEVLSWAKKVMPQAVVKRMTLVMDNLRYAVGGYFKAQFKIMGVVFLILMVGLALLRINYFALIAFLIAFLDFLPFFGTGTAMIPWALYKFLVGDYKTAILLFVIYAVTQLVRQILQPKLVADSMGMNPLVTLLLLYVGYRVSSVLGLILSVPIGMVVINMYQAGAFDYIFDDARILVDGILRLREEPGRRDQN
ncbi:sporulation integral membrane protein YtvI [Schaedlerella sp.]|jgi:sporulation integral membrane protein YtvI|uniref:sporulation integral membrane protein YtvI n=1 Tax=Schaedlerella sp. TaxID=2676057 RepID=UPI003746DFF6|nr:sporulation integral membrane protein YtvI [Ruminococcus sp.]MCI9328412.1 sporulation integral membrane protein YtvI [Ruminococcus sp.]